MDLYVRIVWMLKKSTIIPICGYCIFEMTLCKRCRYCTMFIVIFVNLKHINVTYSNGPI
jgi:hypothetical protein